MRLLGLYVVSAMLLTAFAPTASALAQASGTWVTTGSMTTLRSSGDVSATLLQNGQVLVAGGNNGSTYLASAELYNPATGKWTAAGSGRDLSGPQAVLLANGEVFVVGGGGPTELYNPQTGSWSPGASFDDRNGFSVTLLGTGKVLVAGGLAYSPRPTHTTASALLYDPTTASWQNTGAMNTSRYLQKAVLLQNGQVLVAGGDHIGTASTGLTSAELYQP
jgi:N-acetylneuraminic acid mutarotase